MVNNMFKKIKGGLIFIFVTLFLFTILLTNLTSAQDVNYSNFKVLYDIREDVSWQNGQFIDIVLTNGSIILFDASLDEYEIEACKLTLTNVQKTTRIIGVFSLECFDQNARPFSLTKGTNREIDVNYDDLSDIVLYFKKMDIRTDKVTISIRKAVELEKDNSGLILTLIIIATLILIGLDSYYYIKINKNHYNKIKEMLIQLENHLSLKDYEKAKSLRDEMNSLYKGLTRKQKKNFNQQISELFKQFKNEEDIISKSKL